MVTAELEPLAIFPKLGLDGFGLLLTCFFDRICLFFHGFGSFAFHGVSLVFEGVGLCIGLFLNGFSLLFRCIVSGIIAGGEPESCCTCQKQRCTRHIEDFHTVLLYLLSEV